MNRERIRIKYGKLQFVCWYVSFCSVVDRYPPNKPEVVKETVVLVVDGEDLPEYGSKEFGGKKREMKPSRLKFRLITDLTKSIDTLVNARKITKITLRKFSPDRVNFLKIFYDNKYISVIHAATNID